MGYQLEYRHLKYFLAVASELHYRKAAEKLYISQPGLSKQIKQLENNLGIQLFKRHNRSVMLTESGKYLQAEISKNLRSLNGIIKHAKLIHNGKDGNLQFGYVGSAMQKIIPNLLVKLNEKHPNISFGLKEMENQHQIEGLLSNDIDLGFVRLDRVPRSLEMKSVLKESFCLVLPKSHKITTKSFINLKQFKEESFILFDPKYSAFYHEKVMQIFEDSDFSPIISHNTIHAGSIYKLIENGFGISIVPKSLINLENKNIQFIELDTIKQKTALSIVWNKENRNPVLKKALDLIAEY